MSNTKDNDERGEIDFSWGIKRGRGGQNKEVQFYESFTYDGVEYFLYDSVYLFKEGEAKPYIGKLIKIWEQSNKRKVKVLWFFHPLEISKYLKGEDVLDNELFLASGVGKGLANVNPLEAIAGKCNVVCISKDERNRQPSVVELKMADHVFFRTFDVQNLTISDKLGEKIDKIEVNLLLNKSDFLSLDLPMIDSENAALCLEEPLTSHKYTLAADGSMERDASVGLRSNTGAKSLLDKSECHPVGNISAAGPGNAGLVAGRAIKLDYKDLVRVDDNVDYDGSVGSLLAKDNKGAKRKGDVAGPDDFGPVTSPVIEVALASKGKKRLRSPDSKQNDGKVKCVVPSVTAAANERLKAMKDNQKDAVKLKPDHSDDAPMKKIKIEGTALVTSDNGGTSTPKPATVASIKSSQSVRVGADFNNRGKLTNEFDGTSNSHPIIPKSEDIFGDKLHLASFMQSNDKQVYLHIAANEASQPANGSNETDYKGKLIKNMVVTSNCLSKKLKSNCAVEDKSNDKLRKALVKESDPELEAYGCVKEVTERPPDRSKWFTASPWEERMKDACDQGRLVLLQNLDPAYSSSEVENIVWHGFKENCNAKVVQHTAISSQQSGQAFVIFRMRDIADKIIKKLDKECLMLPNGRPLVGNRDVCFNGKHSQFPGHLIVDKLRPQMQREWREAVSTSHSAQPNTLEYEMALEWRLLQERSDMSWKMLYKRQGEEIKKIKASLKSK